LTFALGVWYNRRSFTTSFWHWRRTKQTYANSH
jgi:hypothetical protein